MLDNGGGSVVRFTYIAVHARFTDWSRRAKSISQGALEVTFYIEAETVKPL